MAAVDYERAWLELKAHLGTKRSHGADELRVTMTEIEVESRVPEGEEGFDMTPPRPRAATPGELEGATTTRPASPAPA